MTFEHNDMHTRDQFYISAC